MPYRHNLPSPSTLIGAHSDSGPTHTDVAHQGIFTPDHLEDQTCFKETLASISLKHIAQAPMRFICPFYNRWDDRIVYASILSFIPCFLLFHSEAEFHMYARRGLPMAHKPTP